MKNSTIIALAAIAALSSAACTKSAQPESTVNEEVCSLSLSFSGGAGTRATGQTAARESMIQNVQVFVFRTGSGADEGLLDACKSAGFDTPLNYDASSSPYSGLKLDCTVGQREIYAIVNADKDYTADGSVLNKESLLSKTIALGDNGPDRLFMLGSVTASLKPGQETHSVTVRRACAGVVLESVKNEMLAPAYRKSGAFKINKVYLTNVPARVNFSMTAAPSSLSETDWYAKMKAESKSSLIYDDMGAVVLDYGKTYNTIHSLYSFPNDCKPGTAAAWSPRATRLVIEASYDDGNGAHSFYYPITLYNDSTNKGLEANRQYRVNLTILRPGSDSPDKPVEFDAVTGSIYVASWEDGGGYTETI